MKSNIETELSVEQWGVDESWAKREKYFLFLRDHPLRHSWRPKNENFINVEHLFDYNEFYNRLVKFETITPFESVWQQWRTANSTYIDPVKTASVAMQHIQNQTVFNLRHVTDTWDQAVIYYYFWLHFGVEVPHNDFADWIESTDQLTALL